MKCKNYSITPLWRKQVMDKKTKMSVVCIDVNLNRQQFRITLKIRCTKADFDAALTSRKESVKELRLKINEYVDKAERIMERLIVPTKETFTRLFKSETDLFSSNKTDVYNIFEMKTGEVMKEGRVGTATYYSACRHNFKLFKPVIYFEEISEKFLKDYQLWCYNRGNSISTIALRIRCLKLMYNYAVDKGFISKAGNPFKGIQTSSAIKSKKVLYPEQLKMLFEYLPKTLREQRAKDMFFFSFLCNGMNWKDIALLKRKNLNHNTITFIREKTKNTSNESNEIQVYLHDEAKRILNKWGNKDLSPESYLFPILPKKFISIEHDEKRRLNQKRIVNKSLHSIGKSLGFDFKLNTALARHSFATTLKLNGTPISFVSEMMGHQSIKTTQSYMKSLPTNELKKVSDSLLNFKDIAG